MHVLNVKIRNNSVKNCSKHLIFASKCPVECPLELNFDFPYVRSPLSLRRDSNANRKTNTRRTGELIYSYIDS